MTGQIPPYGEHFRRESVRYDVTRRWASRCYRLKGAPQWDVASDPTSERWQVRLYQIPVSPVRSTMLEAMNLLLDGADEGWYHVEGDIHAACGCARDDREKKVRAHGLQRGLCNPAFREVRGEAGRL